MCAKYIAKLTRIVEVIGRKISPFLTLFRMGLFGAVHGWGCKKTTFPKICHTYSTKMTLVTFIPYLKKTQKTYESRDTTLDFC